MIYIRPSAYDLKRQLVEMDRDYFSIFALEAFIDYMDDCSIDYEFDAIGFCCEWEEATAEDVISDYGMDTITEFLIDHNYIEASEDGTLSDGIQDENVYDFLNYHTFVMELDNGKFLYQKF